MPERRPVYLDFAAGEIKEIQDTDTMPAALSGGGSFTDLSDTPNSYTSQGGKYVRVNTGESALEFVNPPSGSGDVTGPASSVNNNIALFDGVTGKLLKDAGVALSSKADATHSHAISDVTGLQTALDGKAASSHTHAISDVTGLQTALDGKSDLEHGHAIDEITGLQTALDGKQASLTNGYGLTGTTTKAVSLTTAEAFCTAETTLSAAAYADITGASITLAAGTWVILATINGSSQSTTATVLIAAITTAANAIIAEGAQHIVAGTATVRTWGNVTLSAIVSPGVETTYKLRGARGNTSQTGNCIVSDGTGQATSNNVSNNSDKSTSIRAFRIA